MADPRHVQHQCKEATQWRLHQRPPHRRMTHEYATAAREHRDALHRQVTRNRKRCIINLGEILKVQAPKPIESAQQPCGPNAQPAGAVIEKSVALLIHLQSHTAS